MPTADDAAPADPRPPSEVLLRSLVDDAADVIVTLDGEGTITFANTATYSRLGLTDDLVGRSVLDFVHPDDLERALADLAAQAEHGAPQGTSSFRLRHTDGRWMALEITSSEVWDGERTLLGIWGRSTEDRRATDEIVLRLLAGGGRQDLLEPVCDLFDWRVNGTRIGISWSEPWEGRQFIGTDLPAALVGADEEPGAPWAHSATERVEVDDRSEPDIDSRRRDLAAASGLHSYWIVPVPDAARRHPALITVWGGPIGRPEQIHAYGMGIARTFVELILRWTDQVERLALAATTDELTGLANRSAFFDRLGQASGHGALLFCDLDHFKPVNDTYGHAAGDAVLREVAARLNRTVRAGDFVARVGGDEFAILCEGSTDHEADALVERIEQAFVAPFRVEGQEVQIGISVGVGHATELGDDTLDAADKALYRSKQRRRSTDRPPP